MEHDKVYNMCSPVCLSHGPYIISMQYKTIITRLAQLSWTTHVLTRATSNSNALQT